MTDRKQCSDCGVYSSNADHVCLEYTDKHPCVECGAPTVFVMIAAPGVGQGYECKNGHYDGTNRELTIADVI